MTMRAECCKPRRRLRWALALVPCAALLVPKCPLCCAAYLSLFGVSAAAATLMAPLLRPVALGLCGVALGLVLAYVVRSRVLPLGSVWGRRAASPIASSTRERRVLPAREERVLRDTREYDG